MQLTMRVMHECRHLICGFTCKLKHSNTLIWMTIPLQFYLSWFHQSLLVINAQRMRTGGNYSVYLATLHVSVILFFIVMSVHLDPLSGKHERNLVWVDSLLILIGVHEFVRQSACSQYVSVGLSSVERLPQCCIQIILWHRYSTNI